MPQQSAAIIGGGIMGGDIAIVFAAGGWNVHVMSPSQKTRDALGVRIEAGLRKLGAPVAKAANVRTYEKLEDIDWKNVDFVVEAATEDLPLKQKLFGAIEALARPDIPLTSNTSNFPIGEIGKTLKTRSRVAGLHFFMPAHLVPLVEVVSSDATDPNVAEGMVELMKQLGKAPIWVKKDVPGFVGNRIQHAMMREAFDLIDRGIATPQDIDLAVRYGYGFRYIAAGPLRQRDMNGLVIHRDAAAQIYPTLHNGAKPPRCLDKLVAAGHTGVRAGRGFYQWDPRTLARELERCDALFGTALRLMAKERKKPARG
jgi:3-hydroxybutyryl-CoA dehydrogenase